ncbi:MAG: N-6 DNA methylase [Bauldia sp.]|nr:N-6 DNA methylase [Bauldia sp.]MCW5717056.1 N-6 DNA methylase [Bauldia sp.]
MKPARTLEDRLLARAEHLLQVALGRAGPRTEELRMQVLEAAASRFGGFDVEEFHAATSIAAVRSAGALAELARPVVEEIQRTGIPPALALSALAREELNQAEQRKRGAYHTDFRLALHLAEGVADCLRPGAQVVDPACGAGMLLAAVSIVACGRDRVLSNEWLRHSVHAADLSPAALRGTLLALASLTSDVSSLKAMRGRWRVGDSLLAPDATWHAVAPDGFDLVVANPPWEKVKLTRHEFSRARGTERHYGASYDPYSLTGYEAAREDRAAWAARLVDRYPTVAKGEPDLYVAFTELLLRLTRPGGAGALLVPAGLIRSQGTEALRRQLVAASRSLSLTVIDNRARHFPIDTRFKFLSVQYRRNQAGGRGLASIELRHARGAQDRVEVSRPVRLQFRDLELLRPDLTVPEVRSPEEWRLFRRIQAGAADPSDPRSPWHLEFCREVDMTRDKPHFRREPDKMSLPLVEGRMVQAHRLGAKTYVSGEGRRARWEHLAPGESRIAPQFWMPSRRLSPDAGSRASRTRAGFCDIAGQTNERTMMAAMIPSGVACGNKVPTVLFPNDPSEERLLLWLALVNSLPFDWLMRRVVTTTVNYFVLLSVRLPGVAPDSLPGRRLIEIARRLGELDRVGTASGDVLWRAAELRAEADVLVAGAYGCGDKDVRLILEDFPLLDRSQPPIRGEAASTVTRDLFLTMWSRRRGRPGSDEAARVDEARRAGAVAYLPSEFGDEGDTVEVASA